jgi:hypothetical protein
MAVRVIREEFNQDYRSVVIDDRKLYEEVRDYVGSSNPTLADRVQFYDPEREKLFEVLHELRRTYHDSEIKARQVCTAAGEDAALRDAILEFAADKLGRLQPKNLGLYLKANSGRTDSWIGRVARYSRIPWWLALSLTTRKSL